MSELLTHPQCRQPDRCTGEDPCKEAEHNRCGHPAGQAQMGRWGAVQFAHQQKDSGHHQCSDQDGLHQRTCSRRWCRHEPGEEAGDGDRQTDSGAQDNPTEDGAPQGGSAAGKPGAHGNSVLSAARHVQRSLGAAVVGGPPVQRLLARGAPIPGSIWNGPEAEGRTSKSKIDVGM